MRIIIPPGILGLLLFFACLVGVLFTREPKTIGGFLWMMAVIILIMAVLVTGSELRRQ